GQPGHARRRAVGCRRGRIEADALNLPRRRLSKTDSSDSQLLAGQCPCAGVLLPAAHRSTPWSRSSRCPRPPPPRWPGWPPRGRVRARGPRRALLASAAALGALVLALLPGPARSARAEGGRGYVLVEDGAPYRPLDGKIEVVEVFSYRCGHCARFQPQVDAW